MVSTVTYPLDPAVVGTAAHEFIARLLDQGVRSYGEVDLARAVAEDPGAQGAIVYRQSLRRHLRFAAASYLRLFAPTGGEVFVGAELQAGRVRFDLVWREPQGMFWCDEIKTGRSGFVQGSTSSEKQLRLQLEEGSRMWSENFRGVRVCALRAPATSFMASPQGARTPLRWDHGH